MYTLKDAQKITKPNLKKEIKRIILSSTKEKILELLKKQIRIISDIKMLICV